VAIRGNWEFLSHIENGLFENTLEELIKQWIIMILMKNKFRQEV
jgi:hypothetical protein